MEPAGVAGFAVGGFVVGFAVAVLIGRRARRFRIDWRLTIESDPELGRGPTGPEEPAG